MPSPRKGLTRAAWAGLSGGCNAFPVWRHKSNVWEPTETECLTATGNRYFCNISSREIHKSKQIPVKAVGNDPELK